MNLNDSIRTNFFLYVIIYIALRIRFVFQSGSFTVLVNIWKNSNKPLICLLIAPIQRFERSNNSISQEKEYFRLLGTTHFWSIKLKSVSNTEFRIEAQFVQADIDSHLDHEKNILKILKG